jgi:hypothetical protein
VVLSEPDTGWLLTEYSLLGAPVRSMGLPRPTGQEADREVHLALNAGLALPGPDGGFYFVFLAGRPAFRKYNAKGDLLFERVIQGREVDPLVASLPERWPRRRVGDRELPLVPPVVRTAGVDPRGRLWVSFVVPFTYVFDADGEKVRTLQFRAAGIIAPSSLSFPGGNRVLVAPGCRVRLRLKLTVELMKARLAFLIATLLLVSCGDDGTPTSPTPPLVGSLTEPARRAWWRRRRPRASP